jgi:hypothetical protein
MSAIECRASASIEEEPVTLATAAFATNIKLFMAMATLSE